MNITDYGFLPQKSENTVGIPARVTAAYRDIYEIVCDKGTGLARLKAAEYYAGNEMFPTTGDFVLLDWQGSGESRIIKTLQRTTFFSRTDPSSSGHKEQAVAANFDYVFIIQSLNHDFNARRLERYITLSWQSGGTPVIVLTKQDIAGDYSNVIEAAKGVSAGIDIFPVSAATGYGLTEISEYIKPRKTVVLLGSSGVGKSSLLNALAGNYIMDTAAIREQDSKGRHTTTHRQLVMLPGGGMIIDTPGMRELSMWDVTEGLSQGFSDIEQYFGKCRFSDCKHQSEPGCAVKEAILRGELSEERLQSYFKLKAEARYSDDKEGFLKEKQQWHKNISKYAKAIKKGGKY